MLAFALILALTAHSAIAKPYNCFLNCDGQLGFGGLNNGAAAYNTQPAGFGQMPGYGQTYHQPNGGGGYGQTGQLVRQPSYGGGAGTHGNLEDFGTEMVYPSYNRPSYRPAQMNEVVQQQQIPMQPQIDGLFTHSSSRASYEANQGYLKIHQPGFSRTVISEPIRQPMRQARICEDIYEPCG